MKKFLILGVCLALGFSMTGCSLGSLVDKYLLKNEVEPENTEPDKPRVYMDELRGLLQDFTGNELTVKSDDKLYIFDVSQATLECADGMITGDEISIIYEGQINATDTSSVKALKVVDEFHKKQKLKENVVSGQLQGLTANTVTLRDQNGNVATYPITGTEQYYQNGLYADAWIHLHFKGQYPDGENGSSSALNASHLKVLSVSDIEPMNVPAPAPKSDESDDQEQKMQATIISMNLNRLQVQVNGSETILDLDLTGIPCYFKGGIAPGSQVTISYKGEFDGTTLEGISLLGINGQNPETMKERQISFTVSGTIIGSTSNTITLQTPDNALITCNTTGAMLKTTGGLLSGSTVVVTFNPAASRTSNIYQALQIADA